MNEPQMSSYLLMNLRNYNPIGGYEGGKMLPDGSRLVNLRVYDMIVQRDGTFMKSGRRVAGEKQKPEPVAKPEADAAYQSLAARLRQEQKEDPITGTVPVQEVRDAAKSYEEQEWLKASNRLKGAQRAKVQVRRLITRFSLNDKWDLTFKENLEDLEEAKRHLDNFLRRVRRKVCVCKKLDDLALSRGEKQPPCRCFRYVAVAERQERGAWHFHLAVGLKLSHAEVDALWGHGFVWVRWYDATRGKPGVVSAYLTKYLGKTFTEDGEAGMSGKHRYYRSEGMDVPFSEYWLEPGNLEGFASRMEQGGYKMGREVSPLTIDGIEVGWCASSMLEEDPPTEAGKKQQRE